MNTQNKMLTLNLDRFSFKIQCSKGEAKLFCTMNLFDLGLDNKLNFQLNLGKMVSGSVFNFENNIATNFDVEINDYSTNAEPYIEVVDAYNLKEYFYKVNEESNVYFSPISNTKLRKEEGNREKYSIFSSNEDVLSFYTDKLSYFAEYEYNKSIKYYVSSSSILCLLNGNLFNGPRAIFTYENNRVSSIKIYNTSHSDDSADKYDVINFFYDENDNLTNINYVFYNGVVEQYSIIWDTNSLTVSSSLSKKQIKIIFDINNNVLSYCFDLTGQTREKYTTYFIIMDDYTIIQKGDKFKIFHFDSSGNLDYECNEKGYFSQYETTKYKNDWLLSSISNVLNVGQKSNMTSLLEPIFTEEGVLNWNLTTTNGNASVIQIDNTLNDYLSQIFSNNGSKVSVSSLLNTGTLSTQVTNLNPNNEYIFTTFFKVNSLHTIIKALTLNFTAYFNNIAGEKITKIISCPAVGDSLFKAIKLDFSSTFDSIKVEISIPGNTNIEFYNVGVFNKSYGIHYFYDENGILCKSINENKVSRIKSHYEKLVKFYSNNLFKEIAINEDDNSYTKIVNINNVSSTLKTYSKTNGCLVNVKKQARKDLNPILYSEDYSYDSTRRLTNVSSILVPDVNFEYLYNTNLVKKEYSNHFYNEINYNFSSLSVLNQLYDNPNSLVLQQSNKITYSNKGLTTKYTENSALITQINYNLVNDLTASYCSNLLYEGNSYQESSFVCENLLKSKNINNFVYKYNYDTEEKLTSILNSSNSLIYGFTYNDLDLLKSVTMNDNSKYLFNYNENNRIISQNYINHTINWNYENSILLNNEYSYKNNRYVLNFINKEDSNAAIILNNLVSELLDQPYYVGLFDSSIKLNTDNNPPISNKCLINNYYFKNDTVEYKYVYSAGSSVIIGENQNLKSLNITNNSPIYFEKNVTASNGYFKGSIGFLYQSASASNEMNVLKISILSYNLILYLNSSETMYLKVLKDNNLIYNATLNHQTSSTTYDYINLNYSISSTKININFLSNKTNKNIEISSTLSLAANSIVRFIFCEQNTITPTEQALVIAAVLADFEKNIPLEVVLKHFNTALKIDKIKLNYLDGPSCFNEYESSYYNYDSSFTWIPFKQTTFTSNGEKPITYSKNMLPFVSLKTSNENALYSYKTTLIYKTNLGSVGTLYLKSYLFDIKENQYYFTLKSSNFYLSLFLDTQKNLYFNCNGTTTLLKNISSTSNQENTILFSYQIAQGVCDISFSINNESLISKTASYLTGGVTPILSNFNLYIGGSGQQRTISDINSKTIHEIDCSFNGLISNFIYKNSFISDTLKNKINNLVNPLKSLDVIDGLDRFNKKVISDKGNNIYSHQYEYLSSNNHQTSLISKESINFTNGSSIPSRKFIFSYLNDNNSSQNYKNIYTYNNDTLISNSMYKRYNHNFTYTSQNYIQKEVIRELNNINDISSGNLTNEWETTYSYQNGDISSITYKKNGSIISTKSFTYSQSIPHQLSGFNDLKFVYNGLFISEINFLSGQPKIRFTYKGNELTEYYDIYTNKRMSFAYNHTGQRTSKTNLITNEKIIYYYDSDKLIMETHNNYILRYYYNAQNQLFSFDYCDSNNNILNRYYYIRNALNDIVEIIDQNKNSVVKYVYDAFGNDVVTIDNSGNLNIASKNPFKYRGYYYDVETQLYWVSSRYYSPELCRWISPDSIEYLDPQSINGLNLYAYCGNDPVNKYDPTGHFPWLILAALLLFTPVGGTVVQVAMSAISYFGIWLASIFDEDIRNDMNAIGWNPFNTDESATLNSSKVSFYKGIPVFRTNMERSGSFGAIFLRRGSTDSTGVFHKLNDPDELRHERGHNWQLMMMGIANYGLMIGLPSSGEWSNRSYYERPWEITADVFGCVTGRTHSQEDINRGYWYLGVSSLLGPLGYFFLIGEY